MLPGNLPGSSSYKLSDLFHVTDMAPFLSFSSSVFQSPIPQFSLPFSLPSLFTFLLLSLSPQLFPIRAN